LSKWEDKFVIGLTGNIGTGKSIVRRMLENLGAFGIDADRIAHRTMAQGSPAYPAIVETFGKFILNADGEINRAKLGKLVFQDSEALLMLEDIVHPIVIQAIDVIVKRVSRKVIVIEAIKLIESGISKDCDSLWVTYAPREQQMQRLIEKRKMTAAEARKRIDAQPPQKEKVSKADVVIYNEGSLHETWDKVSEAYNKIVPKVQVGVDTLVAEVRANENKWQVLRGKPKHAEHIAALINKNNDRDKTFTRDEVVSTFGDLAYLLLQENDEIVGLVGWQVENLVSRVTEIIIDPAFTSQDGIEALIKEIEEESKKLQCEVVMIFASKEISKYTQIWSNLGYAVGSEKSFAIKAWREAVKESYKPDSVLYFKQLREERILRPL